MFKFLKNKIKNAVSRISKKIDDEGKEEVIEKEVGLTSEARKPTSLPVGERTEGKEEVKEEIIEKKQAEKEVVEEAKEEIKEEPTEEKEIEEKPEEIKEEPEEKEEPEKPAEEKPEEAIEELKPEIKEEPEKPEEIKPEIHEPEIKEEPVGEPIKEKKGFFGKIKQKLVTKTINEKQFESIFWDLELVLLENNVAVEVIEKIKENLKSELVDQPIPRQKTSELIIDSLKKTIKSLFEKPGIDIIEQLNKKKPFVICFVGINGSGKTTTIAKIIRYLQNNNKTCVIAASDTFRAAAIDQLQQHADKLGVKLIKHDYGADAAAVAFDAVKHAESKNIDAVLIDTAGRMHSNVNLMDEMKKIIRVAKPDLKIFVGESITGNDCTEQAKKFNETIGLDGIILSKADIDEKGGAAISVSHVTGKPILFLGTGQNYEDLEKFEPESFMKSLGL